MFTDITQPDRTTARLSRHGVSVDKVRDRSLLRQGDRHDNPNIAPNRQGDHHGYRKNGKDEFKVTNFWIYMNLFEYIPTIGYTYLINFQLGWLRLHWVIL